MSPLPPKPSVDRAGEAVFPHMRSFRRVLTSVVLAPVPPAMETDR